IAALLAAASAAFDPVAGLVALGDAFLTIAWLIPYFKKEKWTLLKGLAATAVVGIAALVFFFNLQTRRNLEYVQSGSGGLASPNATTPVTREQKEFVDEAAQQQGAVNIITKSAPQKGEANYQGLPARFDIPEGERHSYFGQELLTTDREHAITVVLVSST